MTSNKNIKKIVIISILILAFSLALRLDLNNNYPKGADTYDLQLLSKNVQDNKYIIWDIDFLTSIGFSSFSYPAGGIIFLSEISLITGMNLINSIIIWNIFLLIISGILVYILTKNIFRDKSIALLTTLIYLNSRFFISYSTFFTTRNILVLFCLTTILLLCKKIDIKKMILIGLLVIISFFTHRTAILLGIFILAYIISVKMHKYYQNKTVQNITILAIGIALFFTSVYFLGHETLGTETSRIPFKVGMDYLDQILSVLFSLSMHLGILIILFPVGYLVLVGKKEKTDKDLFILISLTISLPFIIDTIYFFYIFLSLIVIIIAYVLEKIWALNKKNIKIITGGIIIIAIIMPLYITILNSESSDLLIVRPQTVEVGIFLDNMKIEKSIACNNHAVYCSQISALSENVTALTYNSGRTMIDKMIIRKTYTNLANIKNKIIYKDTILDTPLFADSYTSAIINWDINKNTMKKLIKFTNLGYIIDSNNKDSIQNRKKIEEKFRNTNQIYDNGLQQVKVIK